MMRKGMRKTTKMSLRKKNEEIAFQSLSASSGCPFSAHICHDFVNTISDALIMQTN